MASIHARILHNRPPIVASGSCSPWRESDLCVPFPLTYRQAAGTERNASARKLAYSPAFTCHFRFTCSRTPCSARSRRVLLTVSRLTLTLTWISESPRGPSRRSSMI